MEVHRAGGWGGSGKWHQWGDSITHFSALLSPYGIGWNESLEHPPIDLNGERKLIVQWRVCDNNLILSLSFIFSFHFSSLSGASRSNDQIEAWATGGVHPSKLQGSYKWTEEILSIRHIRRKGRGCVSGLNVIFNLIVTGHSGNVLRLLFYSVKGSGNFWIHKTPVLFQTRLCLV